MPGVIHEAGVAHLQALYDVRTKGFARAVRNEICDKEGFIDEALSLSLKQLRPDAWLLQPEKRVAICFEVQVTHPLSESQIKAYVDAWFYMDCECWGLGLVAVDRLLKETQVQLVDWHRALEKLAA
jgi:hypothetical protein